MEAVAEAARLPLSDPSVTRVHEPEIATVELGAGQACRVYEATLSDTGFRGEPVAVESVHYNVLASVRRDEILVLKGTWVGGAAGPGMVELVDRIAATLTFKPRGSDDKPRPVLAAPGARTWRTS